MLKNPFKKYRGFIKGSILNVFAFKFEIFGWILQSILSLALLVFLWFAIFKEKGDLNTPINGYTYAQMIYYQIMVLITGLWTSQSSSFDLLTDDIREGNISISLTKPVSYRGRCLSCSIGNSIANFFLFALPLYIIAILICTFALNMPFPAWYNIIFYLICGVLAIVLFDSFDFLLGQLGFITNSLFGIYVIKGTLLSFLSGAMIPFSFFPGWMRDILIYLPFTGLSSTPINIYLGYYTITDSLIKLSISFGWAVVIYFLSIYANHIMIKHAEVAGG